MSMKLLDPTLQGLTTGEEAHAVNALKAELIGSLGHDAVYIGREMAEGRRTIHFQEAGPGPGELRARQWSSRHPERAIKISFES